MTHNVHRRLDLHFGTGMRPGEGALLFGALLFAFVLISEEAAAPSPSFQTDKLSCGFQGIAGDLTPTCASSKDALPDRLQELLAGPKIPDEFRFATEKANLSAISPAVMADIPPLVLIHLAAPFLATCSDSALSAIVRRHPQDAVITRTVLLALDAVNSSEKKTRFIRELGAGSVLSDEVQAIIAEAALRWWGPDLSEHALDLAAAGSPLLAALPPGYLAELTPEETSKMLLRLRNHHWNTPNDPEWSKQPPATKRVWMEMFKKDPDSGRGQLVTDASDGLKMLWAGASPDEINDLQYKDEDKETLTRLHSLTKLQVRAFFGKLYLKTALSAMEMNEVFDWALELSPAGLQRFLANATDFSNLPAADASRASLPTMKQVFEQVVASSVIQGRIEDPEQPGRWQDKLKDVGRLAYLISAPLLSSYSDHRLTADVLAAVDTYKLSALQAFYLTKGGAFINLGLPLKVVETFHGLTRAIPTGRLAALRTSSVSSDVLRHLLESIPAVHPGRSAVLFNKLRSSITEHRVLEAVLRNPTPGQFFSLVSAREISEDRVALEQAFSRLKSSARSSFTSFGDWINANLNRKDSIDDRLVYVPYGTLSAVLGSARRELLATGGRRAVWSIDTLLSPQRALVRGAVLGLTCPDVVAMDLVDFPLILTEFNRRRRAAGLSFPKELHHCMQRAMEDYLALKRRIRQYDNKIDLITVMEPNDVEAFGGYLLSSLRPKHIFASRFPEQIVSSIGALSPQDLLSAVPDLKRLEELALLLVDLYRSRRSVGPRCLFALGNLHMFLPPDVIAAIEPHAWKLYVEASAPQAQSLTVCAGSERRDAWHRLVIKAFGSPSLWSSGVVAALGDVLAVLPVDVQASVRVASYKDAGDTLAARTVFHLPTDVPGREQPLPFVEVCRSLLDPSEQASYYWGVRRTVRYYLRAAQGLSDEVVPAASLVRRLQPRSHRTQSFLPSPRHDVAASESTTTTTTTTAVPPLPMDNDPIVQTVPSSTTVSTSSTTTTSTSTTVEPIVEDPFGDMDSYLDSSTNWLEEQTVVGPPKSVIPTSDESVLAASNDSSPEAEAETTLAPSVAPSVAPSDVEEMLEVLDDSSKLTTSNPAPATSTATSTSTSLVLDKHLELYPNQSSGVPEGAGPLNLSDATTRYSVAFDEEGQATTLQAAGFIVDNKNEMRRRRSAAEDNDVEAESESQVGRDVQLQPTCDAIRTLGAAASLALVRGDAGHMLDLQVVDCAEELSKMRLSPPVAREFWTKLPPLQRSVLVGDLGHLVVAITVEEVQMLNLSLSQDRVLDTISVIAQHVSDGEVLDATAARLEQQNPQLRAMAGTARAELSLGPNLDPDSLLVALGPLTCHLQLDLQRLLLSRRGSLLHAASAMQNVGCNSTCLGELARAAVSQTALGSTANWTAEDVRHMGVIVSGLNEDQLKDLQRPLDEVEQPISGITASAVVCMTPDQLQALGDLGVLSPVAAAAVTPFQQQLMASEQEASLMRVRNLKFTRALDKSEIEEVASSSSLQTSSKAVLLFSVLSLVILINTQVP